MEATEQINIQELQIDSLISHYDPESRLWRPIRICVIGLNYLTLMGIEGGIKGWTWNEDIRTIQDTNHYRPYIPEPPKRKRKWFGFIKRLLKK